MAITGFFIARILLILLNNMNIESYKEKVKILNIQKRNSINSINDRYNENVSILMRQYGKKPKTKASIVELIEMFDMALNNQMKGKNVIDLYAKENNKTDEWKKDVLQSKPKEDLRDVFDLLEEDEVIQFLIKKEIYDKRSIINGTVSGAFRRLYKFAKTYDIIQFLINENNKLKHNLSIKNNNNDIDWRTDAQKYRDEGMSLAKISKLTGKHKSAVAKYTKAKV